MQSLSPDGECPDGPAFVEQALRLLRKLQRSASAIASYVSTILAGTRSPLVPAKPRITFQAFQRMQRLNMALQELKAGRSTTDVAFDSGYESLSGFGYTCKN